MQIGVFQVKMDPTNFLGSGSYGTVHKAFSNTGQLAAAKKINTAKLLFTKSKDIPRSELIPDTKSLNHPNIIEIYHYKNEPDRGDLWIIMEFCKYTLDTYLTSACPPTAHRLASLLQAASGVEYLHAQNLAHRDLKPDNIMIKQTSPWPWVKVTDFSYAHDLSGKDTSLMTTLEGNCRWMAPELLDARGNYALDAQQKYNRSVDIYSLGLLFAFTCIDQRGRDWIRQRICKYFMDMSSTY